MRLRATVSYLGTPFSGFAANDGVRTVAGELNDALSRLSGTPVDIVCAGRTDKGVHGRGQVISFDVPDHLDPDDLAYRLNRICEPHIAVRSIETAPHDFSARFDATARTYRYRILNTAEHDPFRADTAWHIAQPLDVDAMQNAARALIGEHDFTSFCRRPDPLPDGTERSLVRVVETAEFIEDDEPGCIDFWIAASSFCHQMVRSITGTLVDIGLARIATGALPGIIAAHDRSRAGRVAPPRGLTLWSVRY